MPLDAFLDRRLLIISGKGGVGKTTVSAAVAALAARHGRRVLVAEVEGKGALPSLFGSGPLEHEPKELAPDLFGMNISPERSLEEYFEVQFRIKRIARPLVSSQLVYYVTHAAPGLRDILMLGTVWHTATKKRSFDLIVLDTPASGHAVSMLRSPEGFLHAVPVGPLATHTRQVVEWLKDSQEVSIHLVSIAEEMPVNETIETTGLLEDKLGMDVANIFLNMQYPALAEDEETAKRIETLSSPDAIGAEAKAAGARLSKSDAQNLYRVIDFYRDRRIIQQQHRTDLVAALQHTAPIVDLPFLFTGNVAGKEIDLLADVIEEQLQ